MSGPKDGGTGAEAPALRPITIDVVSDVVCPWCFVGKRRLEKAIAMTELPLAIRWRPFQLDPTIPPDGKPRRDYLEQKFGDWARIEAMHDKLTATGAADGIGFAFDRITVSPNTLDAHRLVRWAADAGVQEPVVEALFRAYFQEGRDLGDHAVLAGIAEAAGMDRAEIARRLASEEDRDVVQAEIAAAQQMGVTGVPTFILIGRYALVGAQPAEALAEAFTTIAAEMRKAEAG